MRTDLVHQKRSVCTYLENCESWAASYISHNMCRKKEMWLLRSVYVTQSNLTLLEKQYVQLLFSHTSKDIYGKWLELIDWSDTKPAKFVVYMSIQV